MWLYLKAIGGDDVLVNMGIATSIGPANGGSRITFETGNTVVVTPTPAQMAKMLKAA